MQVNPSSITSPSDLSSYLNQSIPDLRKASRPIFVRRDGEDYIRFNAQGFEKFFNVYAIAKKGADTLELTDENSLPIYEAMKKIGKLFKTLALNNCIRNGSIIYEVCRRHQYYMLDRLPKYMNDSNATDLSTKNTALHLLCQDGDERAVQFLIEDDANPNALNAKGETPLFAAVYYNHLNLLRPLILAGADDCQKNNEGKSALDVAQSQGILRETLSTIEKIASSTRTSFYWLKALDLLYREALSTNETTANNNRTISYSLEALDLCY